MLSFSKILLLAAVIAAVVLGTRLLGRARKGGDDDPTKAADTGTDDGVDMVKCRTCGAFVDPDVGGCDRADCPYA